MSGVAPARLALTQLRQQQSLPLPTHRRVPDHTSRKHLRLRWLLPVHFYRPSQLQQTLRGDQEQRQRPHCHLQPQLRPQPSRRSRISNLQVSVSTVSGHPNPTTGDSKAPSEMAKAELRRREGRFLRVSFSSGEWSGLFPTSCEPDCALSALAHAHSPWDAGLTTQFGASTGPVTCAHGAPSHTNTLSCGINGQFDSSPPICPSPSKSNSLIIKLDGKLIDTEVS